MRPTLYEFAGGEKVFAAFAAALHARCLADPELNHPFSHPGQNPRHVERLAAYLAEAMGGPPRYSGEYGGDQTALLLLHAGNGDMSDLGRRFADCFMGAADDAGWPDDPRFRAAIRGYIERSVDVVALSHPNDTDVPADLPIPHWSWDGPQELARGRPGRPGPVHERLDAVQNPVDPEQELLALRRRPARAALAGARRGPGNPVQPGVGLLVRQFP
jgi:hemoglobin